MDHDLCSLDNATGLDTMTYDLILSPDWQNTITSSGSRRKNNGTRIEEIEEGFAEDELSFGRVVTTTKP